MVLLIGRQPGGGEPSLTCRSSDGRGRKGIDPQKGYLGGLDQVFGQDGFDLLEQDHGLGFDQIQIFVTDRPGQNLLLGDPSRLDASVGRRRIGARRNRHGKDCRQHHVEFGMPKAISGQAVRLRLEDHVGGNLKATRGAVELRFAIEERLS